MKYLFFWALLFPCLLFGQGIQFVEKTPLEAIAMAKRADKFVFLDFGATWCRPCIMMEQGTFKDDSVGRFFDKHFISVHIDADKQPEWVAYYKVPTYPHLVILNQKGEELWNYTSYVDAAFLLRNAKNAIQYFEEKYAYEHNPKNVVFLQKYLETLPKHTDFKDSVIHIVQGFLAQFPQKEWIQSPHWELINEYLTNIELREYQYFLTHVNEFPTQQQKLKPYIYDNLIAYKNKVLKKPNQIAWEIYKQNYVIALQQFKEMNFPQEYYLLQADRTFFAAKKDETAYLAAAQTYLTSYCPKQADAYAEVAIEILQHFRPISPLWANAEEWAKKALALDAFSMQANYANAYLKFRQKDFTYALKLAEKAKSLALDAADKQKTQDLIDKIGQQMK